MDGRLTLWSVGAGVLVVLVGSCSGKSKCSEFSVGLCSPDPAELVENIQIPDGPSALATCQFLCQIQDFCSTYRYNRMLGECELYHYRYVSSCELVGGPVDPPVNDCIWYVDARSCDAFEEEECEYESHVVLDKNTITDLHSCQEFLLGLGPILNASYFVYNSQSHNCKLYSTSQRTCTTSMGPKFPDIDECNDSPPTSTTATTTVTTTIASTTTTVTTTITSTTGSTTTAAPTTTIYTECDVPEGIENGQWFCDSNLAGNPVRCFLTCDSGFASFQLVTQCIGDHVWSILPESFICSPGVMMLVGGSTKEAEVSVEVISSTGHCRDDSILPAPRSLGLIEILDNKVLLCGGTNISATFKDCFNLNLATWSWERHSRLFSERIEASGVRVKNTFIISGGSDVSGTELMDPNVDTYWRKGPELPAGVRSVVGACSLPWGLDSFLLIGGSYTDPEIIPGNSVLLYNSTMGRWISFPSLLRNRSSHACARIGDKILVAGGSDGVDLSSELSTEILDHRATGFRAVGNLNWPRSSAKIGVIGSNRVFISGGVSTETGDIHSSLEEFDVERGTWRLIEGGINVERAGHGLVVLPNTICNKYG